MGIFKEFKEFAVKGNMIDMAVGIIIGTAFNKVVDVLVKQIIMPPLSMLTDGISYANRKFVLRDGIGAEGDVNYIEEISIGYGLLIETLIDFIVIGFVVFLVVKFMNRFRNKAQDPKNTEVVTPKDIELLSSLNDKMEEQNKLLRERQN
ncbi:large conductance mechanosensitive channel protein MscL [Christiangramia forsetii]|uniref:Large-conductance mechanosensitive channel n=2 Tax=Christiangramia forsetii TaxID=411153 RepID=A0M1G0_CHRFK|nr:large conductance mechanosensitive channel protein MscL [Christiangramia forsetii]GGG42600.1 large-conductance mechanosensitive channel [Christiangramia forsetii]CAL66455.1 large-conductance mechanosensitive channel [Christiangramia forsetii KT0803]